MAGHEISPELVLVSPDLRESALGGLPAIDPDALFEVAPRPPAPRRTPLPMALAAYTAEALLYGAIRAAAMLAVIVLAAYLLAR